MIRGVRTLLYKEVLRFWKVGFQTVAAPVLTAVMYLLIFGHVLSDKVQVFGNVGYTRFLMPGLVMMSVLQNSFANSSQLAGAEQDHRQPGVPAGHAAVALGLVYGLRGCGGGARADASAWACWPSPSGSRRRTWRSRCGSSPSRCSAPACWARWA